MNQSIKKIIPTPLVATLKTLRDRIRFYRIGLPRTRTDLKMVYYGSAYGGYAVPPDIVRNATGVSFGAGEDVSFEIAIAEELGAQVHIFDPTPRSINYCERILSEPSDVMQRELITFHPYGAWSESKMIRFYAPSNLDHVSHSVVNLQNTSEYFEAKVLSPNDVIAQIQGDSIQFLKLNIEGAEYEVIRSWFEAGQRPKVICINFDELHSPGDSGAAKRLRCLVNDFTNASYVPIHTSATKVTYLRTD